MTREEAIQRLKANRDAMYFPETIEALDMAIEALQKDIERHEMVIRASERHLGIVRCKDCISCWKHDGIAECTYCGNRKVVPLNGYCHNAERKGGEDK